MVQKAVSKLSSNHGASMILAMALFLVCTMVSAVIVSTAASGISRNANRVEQQRAYLAVSSASDYLLEEFEKAKNYKYVGSTIEKEYDCEDCSIAATMEYFGQSISGYRLDAKFILNPLDDGHLMIPKEHTSGVIGKKTVEEDCVYKGKIGRMLHRAAESVYLNNRSYSEQIRLNLKNEESNMPEVICDFTMNTEYDVVVVIHTQDSDYAVTIEVSGMKADRTPVITPDLTDEHVVYYKKLNENGAFEDAQILQPIAAREISTITEISWGTPFVEKGGLSQ